MGVGVVVGVAVGVAVAVLLGVAVSVLAAVGVAVAGLGVAVAASGRGVAVLPARGWVGVAVVVEAAVAVGVVSETPFAPASCAARTWLCVPSSSSSPAPLLPCSCDSSWGNREAVSVCPGCWGVVTLPSAGVARQALPVRTTTGRANPTNPSRRRRDRMRNMAEGYGRGSSASIGLDADPSGPKCVRDRPTKGPIGGEDRAQGATPHPERW